MIRVNIDPSAGELPATIADETTQLMLSPSSGKLGGLILANVVALYAAMKVPVVVTAVPFVRPGDTTAYASGDLVANNTTAGSVVPISLPLARVNAGLVTIKRVRLKKSGTSVTNSAFRVHLFGAAPVAAVGDNAAISTTGAGTYVGAFDIATMQAFTDGAVGVGIPLVGTEIQVLSGTGSKVIFALLEARGAYTPGNAESFTLSAEALQS